MCGWVGGVGWVGGDIAGLDELLCKHLLVLLCSCASGKLWVTHISSFPQPEMPY